MNASEAERGKVKNIELLKKGDRACFGNYGRVKGYYVGTVVSVGRKNVKLDVKSDRYGSHILSFPVESYQAHYASSAASAGVPAGEPPKEHEETPGQKLCREINAAIGELEKKIDSPETEKTVRSWLKFHSQFHSYSMMNSFWLMTQSLIRGTAPERFAAFRKWTVLKGANGEKVTVNKGEHGYKILFPMSFPIYERDEKGQFKRDASGKRIQARDENTGELRQSVSFGEGYVFDVNQTNAKAVGAYRMLEHRGEVVSVTDETVKELAARIEKEYGFPVSFVSEPSNGAGGWYDTIAKTITVNEAVAKDNSHQLGTLFHELGHGIMHGADPEKYTRPVKEGQAEAFAYAASLQFGVERKSELYIKSWLDGEDAALSDVLKEIAGNVSKAFDLLRLPELSAAETLRREERKAAEKSLSEILGIAEETKESVASGEEKMIAMSGLFGSLKVPASEAMRGEVCLYLDNFIPTRKLGKYARELSNERIADLYALAESCRAENLSDDFTAVRLSHRIAEMKQADKVLSRRENAAASGQLCFGI